MLQFNTVKRRLHSVVTFRASHFFVMLVSMLCFDILQLAFAPAWAGWLGGWVTMALSSLTTLAFAIFHRERSRPYRRKPEPTATPPDNGIPEESASFYRIILDADPNLIYVRDHLGRYRYCNQALAGFWGAQRSEILGKPAAGAPLPGGWQPPTLHGDDAVLQSGLEEDAVEEQIADSRGKPRWFQVTRRRVTFTAGESPSLVGIASDISRLKTFEDRLAYERLHDPLTGLPNLDAFKSFLQDRTRADQKDGMYALLLLDVDHFRRVNESHGYSFGDQLMIAVARRLAACIRSSDFIIRLKGDEFAVLVDELNDREEVNLVIQRIFEKLHRPFTIQEHEHTLSASIGIVFGSGSTTRAEEMLRDAEIAVNLAKQQGKSRCVIFDEIMRETLKEKVSLEADLRMAVHNGELLLHYQPIISHETGQVTMMEALVRWAHPSRGLVFPNDFIPLAEESDLIVHVGEWVLRAACRQTRDWQAAYPARPPITVSVNISSKQLLHPGFVEQVQAILNESGLAPRHLKMEITESIFLGRSEQVIRVLHQLSEIGVQLYIDDFGTGYSSLSYLSQIPFDAIKIDRCFIDGVISRDGDMKIVEAIVRLAIDLGKDLVAEGVETIEQRRWLQQLGCKYEQGYLFSKPIPAPEVERLFLSGEPLA